jgi:hypothetical protein
MANLTAIAYYKGIPPNNSNLEKPKILDYFCDGVDAAGDKAIRHHGMQALACDVALIQGFVHDHGKSLPHLVLRREAIELQKKNNKRSLIVDSNLFLYVNKENPLHYLRYSFDGVFPTTGFYFDLDVDTTRWEKIKGDLNIDLKPWRSSGNHILICLQRNGGWSMGAVNILTWLPSMISQIRRYSNRPIVIRTHPGDKKTRPLIKINQPNVTISSNDRLVDDLKNAWCTITYNSSPGVASAIEGIPVFVTDPDPKRSQCFEVANTNLENLENPIVPERLAWIQKLSMSHWKFDELKSGEAWSFFRKYI